MKVEGKEQILREKRMDDKHKKLLLLAFLFLLLFLWLQNQSRSLQKWNGRVRRENGVTIIENKGNGLYGKKIMDKIHFKEILSLGLEKGPEYLMFGRHIMIDVDSNQNIFVLDIQNYRLLKFDQNGQLKWRTGSKGQGPGEIEAPFDIKTTYEGGIVIADQGGKINFFDKNGNFQKMVKLEKVIKSIISFSNDGIIFANLWVTGRPGIAAAYFSEEGKFIKFFPVQYRYGPELSPRRAYNLGGSFKLFGNRLFLSLPDKYEIRVFSSEDKLLMKIRRDIKIRPPILKNGYKFVIRDISGPCYLNSNTFLINKLYLEDNKHKDIHKTYLDFFNEKFEFLGSYTLQDDLYLSKIDQFDNFYFVKTYPFIKLTKCTLKIV